MHLTVSIQTTVTDPEVDIWKGVSERLFFDEQYTKTEKTCTVTYLDRLDSRQILNRCGTHRHAVG